MIVVNAYKSAIRNADYPATVPVDSAWRLLIGFGGFSGLIAFYFRFTIPETPRFTMDIQRNITQATRDINYILSVNRYTARGVVGEEIIRTPRASLADFKRYFSKWKNLKVLIGTAYSWFALDVSAYLALAVCMS